MIVVNFVFLYLIEKRWYRFTGGSEDTFSHLGRMETRSPAARDRRTDSIIRIFHSIYLNTNKLVDFN